jgi:ABC-type transport system substrate-binding protein
VHVQYSNATPAAAIGRHVTSVLNQIGYHADLTLTSDPPGLVRNIGPSSPFNVTGTGWQADYPSITQYYTPLISCEAGSYLAGICNPALDKLAQQAIQTSASDPAGGLRLWQQLYQKLDADARIIATVSGQPGNVFISPRLRNYVVSPVQGVQLDQMWTQ